MFKTIEKLNTSQAFDIKELIFLKDDIVVFLKSHFRDRY